MRFLSVLSGALCLVGLTGCDDGAPDAGKIAAIIMPTLSSNISRADTMEAIENVLPQVITRLESGPPPPPAPQTAVDLGTKYVAGDWELSDPGSMWDRVSPDPGLGAPPPAPGGN